MSLDHVTPIFSGYFWPPCSHCKQVQWRYSYAKWVIHYHQMTSKKVAYRYELTSALVWKGGPSLFHQKITPLQVTCTLSVTSNGRQWFTSVLHHWHNFNCTHRVKIGWQYWLCCRFSTSFTSIVMKLLISLPNCIQVESNLAVHCYNHNNASSLMTSLLIWGFNVNYDLQTTCSRLKTAKVTN